MPYSPLPISDYGLFSPLKITSMEFLLCTLLFPGIRIPYWVRKNQTLSHSCISSSSSSAEFYDYSWYSSDGHIINVQRLFLRCIQHLYIEHQHRLSWLCWVKGGNRSSTSNGTSCVQACPLLGTHILGLCGIPLLDANPDTNLCHCISPQLQHMFLGWWRRVWGQDRSQWWHWRSEHKQWMSSVLWELCWLPVPV